MLCFQNMVEILATTIVLHIYLSFLKLFIILGTCSNCSLLKTLYTM